MVSLYMSLVCKTYLQLTLTLFIPHLSDEEGTGPLYHVYFFNKYKSYKHRVINCSHLTCINPHVTEDGMYLQIDSSTGASSSMS